MKVIIIGGVAGGATAAARLRRISEETEIVLFEKGGHISYANCGLPYYIGGVIPERENLFLQTPEKFGKRFRLSARVNSEVTAIDRERKEVEVTDRTNGHTYRESYDRIILAPGAQPVIPPIPGIEGPNIYTLRNVEDTDRIKAHVRDRAPRRAVVVGAGFIGLETAENLHHLGIQTTIVEMADQVMAPLDFEMAAQVHQHLKHQGVAFHLSDSVVAFEDGPDGKIVRLKSGRSLPADLVILSIGVRPQTELAARAGLEISPRKGIVVNAFLQTSDPDIYAAGDAVEFRNPITGAPTLPYLAGPANRQGRLAADNLIKGNKRSYLGAIGTGIAKIFDIAAASTGLNEKQLKASQTPYLSVIVHSSSHSGYYPGAIPLTIKALFAPDSGKLLGGQIVGFEGVDKRIDLMATILKQGGTIFDLQEIEQAYAPPFSSAKDPVSIAGYAAENILDGSVTPITWSEIPPQGHQLTLVDVRTPEETALGTIPGALTIPLDELRNRLGELRPQQEVVVFCAVGLRGYLAARILTQHGFNRVRNLSGGYKTWELAHQKQSNEDIFASDFVAKDNMIYSTRPQPEAQENQGALMPPVQLDACGLQCPGPIRKLKEGMEALPPGQRLAVTASDPGFARDAGSWCRMTGNILHEVRIEKGIVHALIEKGGAQAPLHDGGHPAAKDKTIVVFSDDLDRAMAALIIANGAASAGRRVSLFFTFWGLNIIRKEQAPRVTKSLMARMLSSMMPSSSRKLKLSKMHWAGMGTRMMRARMKGLNIDSLEDLIQQALGNGVTMTACQMSMDVMGLKAEELLDGVEVGGVASYLESAEQSRTNLFV